MEVAQRPSVRPPTVALARQDLVLASMENMGLEERDVREQSVGR
jgi:hypothetical protein